MTKLQNGSNQALSTQGSYEMLDEKKIVIVCHRLVSKINSREIQGDAGNCVIGSDL